MVLVLGYCHSFSIISVMTNIFYNKLKKEDLDLHTFDWSVIAKATDNFSSTNKLGEGGFGSVYKVINLMQTGVDFLFIS